MDKITMEINWKIQDVTGQTERVVKRVGEMEECIANMEQWDIVKDTLTQLLSNQINRHYKIKCLICTLGATISGSMVSQSMPRALPQLCLLRI